MNNVFFYIVGYDSCKEAPEIVLCSEKYYTEQEFRELCASISVDLYNRRREIWKEYYESVDKFNEQWRKDIKAEGATDENYIAQHEQDEYSQFDGLYTMVADALIDKHGFKNVIFTAKFNPFGRAKFVPKDDWLEYTERDEDLIAIRNKIKN